MYKNGETIKSLSESIKTPYSTVSNWVHGRKMPRKKGLEKLALHYNHSIYYFTTNHVGIDQEIFDPVLSPDFKFKTHKYSFYNPGIYTDLISNFDPSKAEKKITIPDLLLEQYSGDRSVFLTYLTTESINKIIPISSIIAIKKITSPLLLSEGDFVAIDEPSKMFVGKFSHELGEKFYSFFPYCYFSGFTTRHYEWEELEDLKIIGKVVAYFVNL